jgi:hypothetical protein
VNWFDDEREPSPLSQPWQKSVTYRREKVGAPARSSERREHRPVCGSSDRESQILTRRLPTSLRSSKGYGRENEPAGRYGRIE